MIVGTAGHIDHGKTSLVRALTGVDTDRLKEEKARGITIDLGFAYLPVADGGAIGFVDVPGHERFVHTMLAGAAGIDLVLLAVAANDGIMPQTREHLAIIDLLGIRRGLVALTKPDLVDEPRRLAVTEEIREALAGTALAGADVLPVSTPSGEGVEAIRRRLVGEAGDAAGRAGAGGRFRLAVDRCFTIVGAGTIVTGTILSGEVALGDRVTVSPRGLSGRIRSIHAQNRPAERGRTGERCALNLVGDGIGTDAITRGDIVLDPSLHAPTDRIDAELRLLPGAGREVGTWFPVRLHHGATELAARIVPLSGEAVRPGETAPVQIVLERPVAAAAGDRFVVRDTSARETLGGGRFLDLRGACPERRSPERLSLLTALSEPETGRAVAAILAAAPRGFDLDGFARDRGLSARDAQAIADRLGLRRIPSGDGALVLDDPTWTRLRDGLVSCLEAYHREKPDLQGMGLERLRLAAPVRLPGPAFRSVLSLLVGEGAVALSGSWVRGPDHAVRLSGEEEALWCAVAPHLGGAERFRPPRVRDIAALLAEPETRIRHVLKFASRLGRCDEVAHDHFFLRDTVAEMSGIVARLSQGPPAFFTAAQFRDEVQNGRKVAIQILDFFDLHGVTLRRGDLRRANPHRLDLFQPSGIGTGSEESRLR